jgi:hypothetical protein
MSSKIENPQTLTDIIKSEYKKCALSPVYFMKKYVKIQHPQRGTISFNLFPFQEKTLQEFHDFDFNIVLKSRQMGISTLVAAYSLWLMVFHSDKNILVISTKQTVATELISKVRFANKNLPTWFGRFNVKCVEDNKLSLKFQNGSRIQATSSAGDAGRSFALSLLIMDEAAFIDGIDEIWTAAYPTLSTGGRSIILSTPNGVGNFFHKMWRDAESKKVNGLKAFNPIRLPWNLHPERDQTWRDQQTAVAKSPKEAAQECDCDFLTSGATLVDLSIIEWYKETMQREPVECRGLDRSEWVWQYPDYSRMYIVCADVARGDGTDYSSYHVLDAETLDQCVEYKGQIDTTSFGHKLVSVATEYNKALLIIENTGIGWAPIQVVIDSGYPNTFYSTVDLKYVEVQKQLITKFYSEEKKMVPGFSTTIKTRPLIISRLEQYFRDKSVNIFSTRMLSELETFIWDKGKVVAMSGYNDDLCMALGIGLWVRETALKLRNQQLDYSRAMAGSLKRAEYTGSAPIFTNRTSNSGYEQWNMKVGRTGQTENLSWLL